MTAKPRLRWSFSLKAFVTLAALCSTTIKPLMEWLGTPDEIEQDLFSEDPTIDPFTDYSALPGPTSPPASEPSPDSTGEP